MGIREFLAWQRYVTVKRVNAHHRAEWERNNPGGKRGMP